MLRHVWWVLGLVLVAGGVILAFAAQPDPVGAWFAYTPLSEEPDWTMNWEDSRNTGSTLLVSWWQVAGAAVAATGLVVVAASIGFRRGRRRPAVDNPA